MRNKQGRLYLWQTMVCLAAAIAALSLIRYMLYAFAEEDIKKAILLSYKELSIKNPELSKEFAEELHEVAKLGELAMERKALKPHNAQEKKNCEIVSFEKLIFASESRSAKLEEYRFAKVEHEHNAMLSSAKSAYGNQDPKESMKKIYEEIAAKNPDLVRQFVNELHEIAKIGELALESNSSETKDSAGIRNREAVDFDKLLFASEIRSLPFKQIELVKLDKNPAIAYSANANYEQELKMEIAKTYRELKAESQDVAIEFLNEVQEAIERGEIALARADLDSLGQTQKQEPKLVHLEKFLLASEEKSLRSARSERFVERDLPVIELAAAAQDAISASQDDNNIVLASSDIDKSSVPDKSNDLGFGTAGITALDSFGPVSGADDLSSGF